MHFDVSSAIAEDTLDDLGASFGGVSLMCAPFASGILIIQPIFPPIGEVGDSCVKHGARNVRGYRGIMKDAWFKLSICIGMSQHVKGVVLVPSCVPVKLFEFCQVFGKIHHLLMGVVEALDFSS